MQYYKPMSLEENYSNIQSLNNNFGDQINSFIWEYNNILWKYGDVNRYNQLVYYGIINPYLNSLEKELQDLAYGIWGFTSHVFTTLSYALDCWRINTDSKQKNRNVTDKEYDQALQWLVKKNKISESEKNELLNFRFERNYYTHYGRLQFCKYIFEHAYVLHNLIKMIADLLGQMNMDYSMILQFNLEQANYIEEMKNVLDEFMVYNFHIA